MVRKDIKPPLMVQGYRTSTTVSCLSCRSFPAPCPPDFTQLTHKVKGRHHQKFKRITPLDPIARNLLWISNAPLWYKRPSTARAIHPTARAIHPHHPHHPPTTQLVPISRIEPCRCTVRASCSTVFCFSLGFEGWYGNLNRVPLGFRTARLRRKIKTVGSAHTRQGDDPPGPPNVNNNDAFRIPKRLRFSIPYSSTISGRNHAS